MYAANPSLTFVHFLCWFFLALFDFFFYLRIIRTRGRSEGENLSNIRLEIKYIILGVDHLPPAPRNGRIFEMINECTSNLLKLSLLREDFFKGIKLLKKQKTENKLHTKKY